MWLRTCVDIIFGLSLFINALLFVPQAIRLLNAKHSKDLSLVTFVGFWLTQITAVTYGYLHKDYILMYGYMFAAFTCGVVTALIIYYRIQGGIETVNKLCR